MRGPIASLGAHAEGLGRVAFDGHPAIDHFAATGPGQLWVGDLTYLRCFEGLVFFAFVTDALRMALHRRSCGADVELIHHSDAGSQYTSIDFTQTLDDHRVLQSIGSVGDALDNALAESFVDSFKTELIADRVWVSVQSLELAMVDYVGWFNLDRPTNRSATYHPLSSRR